MRRLQWKSRPVTKLHKCRYNCKIKIIIKIKIVKRNENGLIIGYFCPDSETSHQEQIQKFENAARSPVSEVKSLNDLRNINKTKKILMKDNFLKSFCTCSKFLKQYMCAHIIAMALLLKKTDAPLAAKKVPKGKRVGPGRPSKAKKALLRQ